MNQESPAFRQGSVNWLMSTPLCATEGASGTDGAAPETVGAEITCRMGVLDPARRLVAEPRARLAEIATAPERLGRG